MVNIVMQNLSEQDVADIKNVCGETVPDIISLCRRAAYQQEADPLFFKAQRGEATIGEWQAKVAEIKARYPKAED